MTLVTAARGAGIVKVRVLTPKTVNRVSFVAAVKLSVPEAATTVKVTGLLTPAGVVTVTVLAPTVAVDEIEKVVVICVPAALTVSGPTVIPVPDTVTAVAPARFAPVSVTGTISGINTEGPGAPDAGVIPVRVGGISGAEPYSTAPGSKRVSAEVVTSGLALPKKSVGG
jgi:hypothetical protein